MTVTFPHMGTLHIVLKALLTTLGVRVVAPPPTSKATHEIGARHAPETACLPFKTTLATSSRPLKPGPTPSSPAAVAGRAVSVITPPSSGTSSATSATNSP
jgi:hypothetical protein